MNALRAALYKALIPRVGKVLMIDGANTLLNCNAYETCPPSKTIRRRSHL
jgi:hypothetical protein